MSSAANTPQLRCPYTPAVSTFDDRMHRFLIPCFEELTRGLLSGGLSTSFRVLPKDSPSLAWPTLPTAKTGRFDISVKERRDDGDATLKFPHSAVRVGKTVCRVYSVFAEDKGFQGETRTPGKDARRD